jgi:hypothetical protein
MNDFSQQQFSAFFSAISAWRAAYRRARLHFLAVRQGEELSIISARIYLDAGGSDQVKSHFRAGTLEVGQWEIPQTELSVEDATLALIGEHGLLIEGIGRLRLVSDTQNEVFIAPPTLLHPEGLNSGSRFAVLSLAGANWAEWVRQPESDWLLKAADIPYDSVQELCSEYGLGALRGDRSLIEIVARTAVEVLARSEVKGTSAELGIWMASSLDRAKARIGFRVLDKGHVLKRGAVSGNDLSWEDAGLASIGTTQLEIPAGAIVQCIASYGGHAHHLQWRADPSILQNPRAAVLAMVDQSQQTIRGYLQPDLPLRRTAADDFEAAIGWLLWALGFSTATFGTNAKTRDAFDTVAVTPNGDFVVVECTLGLLRADSKLSKLAARAASLRETLATSNMKNLRVLPVIVTAMTAEQVKADLAQAEEIGILVLTKEILDEVFNELLRYPDADRLFERAMVSMEDKRIARLPQKSLNTETV